MLITIDVGLNTGYAIWGNENTLIKHGEIKTYEKSREMNLYKISKSLDILLDIPKEKITKAVIEGVEYQFSLKSFTSTIRGNTFYLAYMVGVIAGLFIERNIYFKIITARQWKGQLTKTATRLRAERALPFLKSEKLSEHVIDAIGIGLSEQGRL